MLMYWSSIGRTSVINATMNCRRRSCETWRRSACVSVGFAMCCSWRHPTPSATQCAAWQCIKCDWLWTSGSPSLAIQWNEISHCVVQRGHILEGVATAESNLRLSSFLAGISYCSPALFQSGRMIQLTVRPGWYLHNYKTLGNNGS
jgi:hypothetical protein